jgi:hypothetical protein
MTRSDTPGSLFGSAERHDARRRPTAIACTSLSRIARRRLTFDTDAGTPRTAAGSWVADHEQVQVGERKMELLVTYHVRDGCISRDR